MGDKTAYHVSIKELPEDERPQEKMIRFGAKSLSNAELLAIIIRTGTKDATSVEVSRKIIEFIDNDLSYFHQVDVLELKRNPNLAGVGIVKACQIKAAIELGIRVKQKNSINVKVSSPSDVVDLLMDEMQYLKQESFKIIILDTKNQIIKVEGISVGILNAALVHPREVFIKAIRQHAAAIILAHNHPSGDPEPSTEDKHITKRLVDAGELLGISVIDHIIIGRGSFLSFKQERLL
ncbi:RadC family protein [Acetobacterium woodii]|uniref:DNA repair protein-like protein n=1 Tax=Acetobacterium woodii (strain ATCC 29683 / DSM 1030 / JCM 2381 / KCTC 1655 / WB1) TaxID=931626 RepID=H6LC26_ACEWD|nr:DNA repair protein RadC [Acetobacterium woodii]AFA48974.1 DNA repair protein-like protein [Acetobacterium woodii DSM 1030]